MRSTAEMRITRVIGKIYRPRECSEKAFFCNHFFAIYARIWQYSHMKRILFILFSYLSLQSVVRAFTGNIGNPKYTFDVDSIFPSPQKVPGDNGVDNVIDYIVAMIPLLTTLMAV